MARGRGRGRGRGGPRRVREEDEGSSEEEFDHRPERGQASTVGMLPPSDSEDESSSEEDDGPKRVQNPNVGAMPPSSSEEDSSDEEGREKKPKSGKKVSFAQPRMAVPDEPTRKTKDGPDEAEMAEQLAKLEIVRKRREEQRLKRIADEGWDRFAPISETNKPPGTSAALLAEGS